MPPKKSGDSGKAGASAASASESKDKKGGTSVKVIYFKDILFERKNK